MNNTMKDCIQQHLHGIRSVCKLKQTTEGAFKKNYQLLLGENSTQHLTANHGLGINSFADSRKTTNI